MSWFTTGRKTVLVRGTLSKGEHVSGDEISMESAGDGSCLKLIEFELQVRIFIFLELVLFELNLSTESWT